MKRRGGIAIALAATVAAALASTAGAGSIGGREDAGSELQEHAQDRLHCPVHGRRRLPRQRAAQLGEVRGQDAAREVRPQDQARHGRHARSSRARRSAQTLAQKFIADKDVVAVLGPSTSGAVAASSQTFFQAGLAHISPSATRTSLTKGATKEATPAFFRVVPDDDIQGPTDANFMIDKLNAKNVVALRLPGAVLAGPRGRGRSRPQGEGRHDDRASRSPTR